MSRWSLFWHIFWSTKIQRDKDHSPCYIDVKYGDHVFRHHFCSCNKGMEYMPDTSLQLLTGYSIEESIKDLREEEDTDSPEFT